MVAVAVFCKQDDHTTQTSEQSRVVSGRKQPQPEPVNSAVSAPTQNSNTDKSRFWERYGFFLFFALSFSFCLFFFVFMMCVSVFFFFSCSCFFLFPCWYDQERLFDKKKWDEWNHDSDNAVYDNSYCNMTYVGGIYDLTHSCIEYSVSIYCEDETRWSIQEIQS